MEDNQNSINQPLIGRLPKSLTTVTAFSKLIALFLFALLPLAGFMVGSRFQAKLDSSKTLNVISNVQPSPVPSRNETIDTSNWNTYKNTMYGFELKYPEKWTIKTRASTSEGTNIDLVDEAKSLELQNLLAQCKTNQDLPQCQTEPSGLPGIFLFVSSMDKKSQEEFFKEKAGQVFQPKIENIANLTVLKGSSPSVGASKYYFMISPDKTKQFMITANTSDQTVKNFLSTFKFTN